MAFSALLSDSASSAPSSSVSTCGCLRNLAREEKDGRAATFCDLNGGSPARPSTLNSKRHTVAMSCTAAST
eukprot:9621195-Lingulodinium_polyedra.AAC.1